MKELTLDQLKKLHDKAYAYSQITRERASDDLVFYHVTQWDDGLLAESQLSYRGEFNQLKKAGRQIMSDLAENPIQVDFQPLDENRDDAAEIADGLYRSDDSHNTSIESYEVGKQESVVCGFGAWKLYTKYVSTRAGDRKQVIRRKPVYEAVNTVFWDPNSRSLDKSDAEYVSVLTAYSEDGYKALVEDLTGEDMGQGWTQGFRNPEQSYVFPWLGGQGAKVYITEFYHKTKEDEMVLTLIDPFGQSLELAEREIDGALDDLVSNGFRVEESRKVERCVIHKYIASGARILKVERIAGEHLPIVPVYGEHAVIEGEEHYEGVTRTAKDPQRLRNFIMSYIADIVSRSPRKKPIFWPEQIKGFENMYIENGPDNNYPFLYANRKAPDGTDLPVGAIGEMPDQPMPSALPPLLAYASDAIKDVADPGLPQNIADPDVSGKAVMALQARVDMQSMVYQQHFKHSKRRDAQVWASMAAEIYDTPRKTMITLPDGTRKYIQTMQAVIDQETGDIVFLNDLRGQEFEVTTRIGPDYGTQREQTIQQLREAADIMQPTDPMREILVYKILMLQNGVDMDDIRKAVRKQLILKGIQEPDTPEEAQMLQAAQNRQAPPSAEMVLAMAEDKKGEAALMKERRETAALQTETMNDVAQRQIDSFNAQTKRMETQIKAQDAGATINQKNIESFGKRLDNTAKLQKLSNDQLLQMAQRMAVA